MPALTPGPQEPRPAPSVKRLGHWRDDPEVGLMLRVQREDGEAFAELERLYRARVFGYFCRRLGDRGEAEDLTQEVFLRLYRARAGYRPRARLATWVFHIAQNVARNALRSRRRRPWVSLDEVPFRGRLVEVLLADRGDGPGRRLEREELAGLVRSALAGLGWRQRTALELYQFGGRTYAEVAAELHLTPKAAKSLLYRARNHIRATLEPLMS